MATDVIMAIPDKVTEVERLFIMALANGATPSVKLYTEIMETVYTYSNKIKEPDNKE